MTGLTAGEQVELGWQNFLEFNREQVRLGGGELTERGGVLLLTGTSFATVLTTAAARVDPAVPAEDVLALAHTHFDAHGRAWLLHVHGEADADLAAAATAAGLTTVVTNPAMDLQAPLVPPTAPGGPEGITLSPVVAVADVRDLAEVTGAAYAEYGLPRAEMVIRFAHPERWLRPYLVAVLARDATTGDALGSGLLVLSHGIGGLYLIATVPEARRRGIGAAVTRALSDHAFAAGARFVTLQASGMGEAIYRRLGFETTTLYRSLLAPA